MWVPPEEKDPIQLLAPTRKSVALFGAVNLGNGKMAHQFALTFNALVFERFLKKLWRRRSRGRRMVVVLDNARYHRASLISRLLETKQDVLQLLFLPPYSPDLNPIERVWKLTRRLCTHNRYFQELDDLLLAVKNQLQDWRKPNLILTKLCGIT
jgi:transposase